MDNKDGYSPEELKERRRERNRLYQLKNKEILKEKRRKKDGRTKRISRAGMSEEEKKERGRELHFLKKGISPPPPLKPKLTQEEKEALVKSRNDKNAEKRRINYYLKKGISPPPPRVRNRWTPEEAIEKRKEYEKRYYASANVKERARELYWLRKGISSPPPLKPKLTQEERSEKRAKRQKEYRKNNLEKLREYDKGKYLRKKGRE